MVGALRGFMPGGEVHAEPSTIAPPGPLRVG